MIENGLINNEKSNFGLKWVVVKICGIYSWL